LQIGNDIVASGESLQIVNAVRPDNALAELTKVLGEFDGGQVLSEDIGELVEMFCCLFEPTAGWPEINQFG